MYKGKNPKWILVILVFIMVFLSFGFNIVNKKLIFIKNEEDFSSVNKSNNKPLNKYGYSDILDSLNKNKDFKLVSINKVEDEKCNVELQYMGDISLLYSDLCRVIESENFLSVNNININKVTKITKLSI